MRLLAAALTLASTHAVHDIVDLYAKPDTSMRTQLGAHFQDGHPVNALVVFHLEGCVFCEITMGTMLYDTTHDGALNATGIQPFKLLVDAEGTPNGTFTFCSGSADCVAQSKKILGVDPAALTSFPTTYYYRERRVRHEVRHRRAPGRPGGLRAGDGRGVRARGQRPEQLGLQRGDEERDDGLRRRVARLGAVREEKLARRQR